MFKSINCVFFIFYKLYILSLLILNMTFILNIIVFIFNNNLKFILISFVFLIIFKLLSFFKIFKVFNKISYFNCFYQFNYKLLKIRIKFILSKK